MTAESTRAATERFVRNLEAAIGPLEVAEVAARTGISERRLRAILAGRRVPDLPELVSLERALDTDLLPPPDE